MTTTTTSDFGRMLKSWRERRKFSQLSLSLEAGVSQRHVSFMESGRAQPSREMILHLSEALDIPWRDRNRLFHAAGFAPAYTQRNLDDEDMDAVRAVLQKMLQHHEPWPALVMNHHWDILMHNDAAGRFMGLLGEPEALWQAVDPTGNHNAMRLVFHEAGMQPKISNWKEVATFLLCRMEKEVSADPNYEPLAELYDELCRYPNLPSDWRNQLWESTPPPVLTMQLEHNGMHVNTYSVLSSFGTALDITAASLHVETFFPADEQSTQFFEMLARLK